MCLIIDGFLKNLASLAFYSFIYCWLCWVFVAACGLLVVVVSLVVNPRLRMCRLSSCGTLAWLPYVSWNPPTPGIEPMSPALAGRFLTTVPPGKLVLFDILSDGVMEEKKALYNHK